MLDIIKSKLKMTYKKRGIINNNITIDYKDFVPVTRDWQNSIYVYNKNTLGLIPIASHYVIKIIRSYFNSYNLKLENKLRKKNFRRKQRKLSINKMFISNGEYKHTNDKVIITLYVYNRQKYNFIYKLRERYLRLFKKNKFIRRLYLIKNLGLNILKQQEQKYEMLYKILPNYKSEIYLIQHLYYKKFIKKSLRRLKYFMLYKQLNYVNNSKFTNLYLQGIINIIKRIYNKNIEFNLINLKYFYYNSNIFSQPLVLKLRKKRKVLRYLNTYIRKVIVKNIKLGNKPKYLFELNNLFNIKDADITNNILYKLLTQNKEKSKFLKKIIFENIRYKRVSGVRLESAGRLTKRYTASRSQYKVSYKGNLENILTSVKGYSSVLLRNNFKPNLEYTKLHSKSRIGSFGIKG
jgi:hypothetical protein